MKDFNMTFLFQGFVTWKHEDDKVIVFERAGLLFAFNFHPTKSFPDYRVGIERSGRYYIALDTDNKKFGGFGRVNHDTQFSTQYHPYAGRKFSFQVCRFVIFLPLS